MKNPLAILGLAFGGGVLLAALMAGKQEVRHPRRNGVPQRSLRDAILTAVAAAVVKEVIPRLA